MPILIAILLIIGCAVWFYGHSRGPTRYRIATANYLEALGNSYSEFNLPRTPLERKINDERYIYSSYGFPVGLLSDILLLLQGEQTANLSKRLDNLPLLTEQSRNGIFRVYDLPPGKTLGNLELLVISGDIRIEVTIFKPGYRQVGDLYSVYDVSSADADRLSQIYHMWMNHDFSRLGILHFLSSIYKEVSYNKLVSHQIGLSDCSTDVDIGACHWTHKLDPLTDIHEYSIRYAGNHYIVFVSEHDRRFIINDDYIDLKQFKLATKEIINGTL